MCPPHVCVDHIGHTSIGHRNSANDLPGVEIESVLVTYVLQHISHPADCLSYSRPAHAPGPWNSAGSIRTMLLYKRVARQLLHYGLRVQRVSPASENHVPENEIGDY